MTTSVIGNVRGLWNSNIGLTFDITQPSLNENAFSWTVRQRPMPGKGTIAGLRITVSWTDFGQQFNATGVIEAGADGRATKITLNNGAILTRPPSGLTIDFPPPQ